MKLPCLLSTRRPHSARSAVRIIGFKPDWSQAFRVWCVVGVGDKVLAPGQVSRVPYVGAIEYAMVAERGCMQSVNVSSAAWLVMLTIC